MSKSDVPIRTLGKCGERVSALGLGGYHIGRPSLSESESVRIIRSAIDRGITFMDNSWDYNEGRSEVRMGEALQNGYRNKVFLMTKIDGHTKALASTQIEESLRRLNVDRVDLLQLHEIIRPEDPDRIFAMNGAIEAMTEAKAEGRTRFIGFTGHKSPTIHLKMLETAAYNGFVFDTVQMPLNLMDTHFNSFERTVLPILVRQNTGVIGMKPMGDAQILKSNTVTPIECLHYALNLPASVVITGIDSMEILDQAIHAAKTFRPMSEVDMDKLRAKTISVALRGDYERYKTTTDFDSTVANPHWLR